MLSAVLWHTAWRRAAARCSVCHGKVYISGQKYMRTYVPGLCKLFNEIMPIQWLHCLSIIMCSEVRLGWLCGWPMWIRCLHGIGWLRVVNFKLWCLNLVGLWLCSYVRMWLARWISSKLCLNMRFRHKNGAHMMHACMMHWWWMQRLHSLLKGAVLGLVIWLATLYGWKVKIVRW